MSEGELPEGWATATLGVLGDWGSGGTPLRTRPEYFTGGTIPWLKIGDLNDGIVTSSAEAITDLGLRSSSAKLLPKGVLLVAMYGSIGKLGITGIPCATNQAIAFCQPYRSRADLRFLFWLLRSEREALLGFGKGGTQQNISQTVLRAFEVPLPPLAEQKRIVAKVEKLLARVNAARGRLARVPAILKRFHQAVLAAACDGRLTEGWRSARTSAGEDDPELPGGWKRIDAGATYLVADYGTSVKCDRDDHGTPVLRVPNIASGRLDTADLKFAPKGSVNLSSLAVSPGDVLICRTNGSLDLIGKAALVPVLPETFSFASYLIRVRPDADVLRPALFHLFLLSPVARHQIEDRARTTAGQFNLNLQILRGLEMVLPPPDEQDEIVRRVEALFQLADTIEKRVAAATARAEKLTQSILARAFRGELVPTEAEAG